MIPFETGLTGIGFTLVILGIWFFSLKKHSTVRAGINKRGYQEALVIVERGYTPDTVIVQQGKPVRLNFLRSESNLCSHTLQLAAFGKSVQLIEDEVTVIEFFPNNAGEFDFQCQMGMLQGKLIVE